MCHPSPEVRLALACSSSLLKGREASEFSLICLVLTHCQKNPQNKHGNISQGKH